MQFQYLRLNLLLKLSQMANITVLYTIKFFCENKFKTKTNQF